MDPSEEVIFEDYLYKLSEPKGVAGKIQLIGKSKWKQKYFQIKKIGDKPALDYFNKKPKTKNTTPKGRIWLQPSFRIEKIPNTKNRAFVFELTTPTNQICVSAEEQKITDMFVFILQIQAKLMDTIKDNLIIVQPENSEAMRRVGAVGTCCILHASPWGMTLALKESRCIVAQWPIKSIRCYESSGRGLLTLEAGRVAPMGEGIYVFRTVPEEDSSMYDLLDKYIMETLDRSKITRRGTDQEIEDYLQEFDQMHTLTAVRPCPLTATGIPRILRENWNYNVPGAQIEENNNPVRNGRFPLNTQNSLTSVTSNNSAKSAPESQAHGVSHVRQHLPVTHSNSANQIDESRLTGRPPPPPPRPMKIPHTNGVLGRVVPRPKMSASQLSQDGYLGMSNSTPSPSKSLASNPMSPKSPAFQNWEAPPSFNDVMDFSSPRLTGSGYLSPVANDGEQFDMSFRSNTNQRTSNISYPGSEASHRNSDASLRSADASAYLSPVSSDGSYMKGGMIDPMIGHMTDHLTGYQPHIPHSHSYENTLEAKQSMDDLDLKQASASCEDLSDHMKQQLYFDPSDNNNTPNGNPEVDENMNSDKPPMPFTRLQAFRNSADWDSRDRSKSVDYYNVLRPNILTDRSPSPSMRRIRRIMGKGNQENLRKSVSNPNFLNVGSREVWSYVKSNNYRPSSCHNSPKLERQSRGKSRSLVELLPAAVRRHLSHENLPRSRNPTPSHSRSTTPERNAKHNKHSNKQVLNRQESAKSFEASVKNIKVTDRSRSFRKVKSLENEADNSKAAEKPPKTRQRPPHPDRSNGHPTHNPHYRQSSNDSTQGTNGQSSHYRQSSNDSSHGHSNHFRQSSNDSSHGQNIHSSHFRQTSNDSSHGQNIHSSHFRQSSNDSSHHVQRGSDSFRRNQNMAYIPVHHLMNPTFRHDNQSNA